MDKHEIFLFDSSNSKIVNNKFEKSYKIRTKIFKKKRLKRKKTFYLKISQINHKESEKNSKKGILDTHDRIHNFESDITPLDFP